MPQFVDVQFQSAREKERVYRDWTRFLKQLTPAIESGSVEQYFTQRLYHHLSQHCSYIAHYNRHGFIDTYFRDPETTPYFLQQFDSDEGYVSWEYSSTHWCDGPNGDYSDINRAMCDAFEPLKADIYADLARQTRAKKQAQIDRLQRELKAME